MNIQNAIIQNKISIDYCGKSIFAGIKNSSGIVIKNSCVKFNETSGDEQKALELAIQRVLEG